MCQATYDPKTNRGIDSSGVRYWKVRFAHRRCPLWLGQFQCDRDAGHRGLHRYEQYRWRTPKAAPKPLGNDGEQVPVRGEDGSGKCSPTPHGSDGPREGE